MNRDRHASAIRNALEAAARDGFLDAEDVADLTIRVDSVLKVNPWARAALPAPAAKKPTTRGAR